MNRRSFLRSSLVFGALSTFPASAAVTTIGQKSSRSGPLRVGFLGMTHPHAAGKLKAVLGSGSQTIPMPAYARYAPELEDLADAIRTNRPLTVTPEEDLLVQETLMRACDMEAD
jgi:hypothetical protein